MSAAAEDRSVLSRPARRPDAVLHYGAGPEQVADLYRPRPDGHAVAATGVAAGSGLPLIILVHGGYWRPEYDRVHLRPMAEALAAAGWTVAVPEYARIPGRPDAALGEVELALERLPHQVAGCAAGAVLVGHSAGGHLALCAAARAGAGAPGLSAVLALAPVGDLQLADELDLDGGAVRQFLGGPASRRPDLDPCQLALPAVPVTLIHGATDGRVPLALSESYAASHPGARLVRLANAGHFAVIDPLSRVWSAVLGELRLLGAAAAPG